MYLGRSTGSLLIAVWLGALAGELPRPAAVVVTATSMTAGAASFALRWLRHGRPLR